MGWVFTRYFSSKIWRISTSYSVFLDDLTTITGWWLTYPSEKWWSSSVGMMKSPIYGNIKFMFQTTNQIKLVLLHGNIINNNHSEGKFSIRKLCRYHSMEKTWWIFIENSWGYKGNINIKREHIGYSSVNYVFFQSSMSLINIKPQIKILSLHRL